MIYKNVFRRISIMQILFLVSFYEKKVFIMEKAPFVQIYMDVKLDLVSISVLREYS